MQQATVTCIFFGTFVMFHKICNRLQWHAYYLEHCIFIGTSYIHQSCLNSLNTVFLLVQSRSCDLNGGLSLDESRLHNSCKGVTLISDDAYSLEHFLCSSKYARILDPEPYRVGVFWRKNVPGVPVNVITVDLLAYYLEHFSCSKKYALD